MPATPGYTPELFSLTVAVEILWADRLVKNRAQHDPVATLKVVKENSCNAIERHYETLKPSPTNHETIQRAISHHELFWEEVRQRVVQRLEQLRKAGQP